MLFAALYSALRLVLELVQLESKDAVGLKAEVLALRQQVRVLERQIKRARWQPGDRLILSVLRERLPRTAWASLLVQPETVLGWHRELVRRRWAAYRGRPRVGRPPLAGECRELIQRMARENPNWGYFRIRGELLKLGCTVSATAIRSVLRRSGIPPAGRRSRLTWKRFLAAHAQTLVAADFFTVDTVFLKRLYVLFFIHLASRRILWAASTRAPDTAWVTQQARNLFWELAEEETEVTVMIHDRDRKFARGLDTVCEAEGARVVLTPLMAPRANAHAERWVGSARRECMDWILIVGQKHLEAVLREYVEHYNTERPHQSRELEPPAGAKLPIGTGRVGRRQRLGGLIHEYRRELQAA
jgi:transposase InsO family protein